MLIRGRFPEQQNGDDGCCEALSPMPCSLAMKGLHQNEGEWLLWLGVTRKVGQKRSDGGVDESSGVCLLCERA